MVSTAKGAFLQADSGKNTIDNTKPIINDGTINVAAKLTIDGPVTNNGTLIVSDSLEIDGAVTGKGQATLGGGTLKFDGASSTGVTFQDMGNTLDLFDPLKFTGTVAGMTPDDGNAIDLENMPWADHVFVNQPVNGKMTVIDSIAHVTDTIKMAGGGTFTSQEASDGSTLIIATTPPVSPAPALHSAHLLAQAMASFGASSSVTGSAHGGVADTYGPSDFLAAPHHG